MGLIRSINLSYKIEWKEIRDLVDPEFRSYCNTKENPADITSKGCKASELVNNDLWWKGPEFLKESDERWSNIVEFTSETRKSREGNEGK